MDSKVIIYGIAAWFFPGLGHFLQKRWQRGAIIALGILIMLIVGWSMNGAYLFEIGGSQGLLVLFEKFSVLGNAGVYLFHFFTGGSATFKQVQEAVKAPTIEYGVRFLAVAGLLNYLSILDAIDIALGRKK